MKSIVAEIEAIRLAIKNKNDNTVDGYGPPASAGHGGGAGAGGAAGGKEEDDQVECSSCGDLCDSSKVKWIAGDPLHLSSDGGDGEEHPYCAQCAKKIKTSKLAGLDKQKLQGYIPLLKAIDKAVDALDKYDRDGGYGDMAQNFENPERERFTKELINMIQSDMKKAR